MASITGSPTPSATEGNMHASAQEYNLGKFKNSDSLLSSYNALQSDYTKKCQALKELTKQIEEQNLLKLEEENKQKDTATNSMCTFLAMNTAGFQIIPATVIAVLVGLGAEKPTEIILPTLIVTTLSFLVAIIVSLIFSKIWQKEGE